MLSQNVIVEQANSLVFKALVRCNQICINTYELRWIGVKLELNFHLNPPTKVNPITSKQSLRAPVKSGKLSKEEIEQFT